MGLGGGGGVCLGVGRGNDGTRRCALFRKRDETGEIQFGKKRTRMNTSSFWCARMISG